MAKRFLSPCENPVKFAAKILALQNPCEISQGLRNFVEGCENVVSLYF